MTHPNCRIQDVTSLALFVHLSGLFISVILPINYLFPCLYYIKLLIGEGGGGGGFGGGVGAIPINYLFPCLFYIKLLISEGGGGGGFGGGGGGGGGVQNIMASIK